jgi:dihydrofolate synthase / folylpolyglutamate synthase
MSRASGVSHDPRQMSEAETYIDSLELMGMQFGLERMRALLDRLGNPEAAFDAIHVVGSNGKSSTVRFSEALLEAEGVRSGAYLSPHLTTFRERIRVGGETIEPEPYERAVLRVAGAASEEGVTQFEALTAAAFVAFAEAGVEWAVVEAGLGGRLDATNVLPRSQVQVLTNVALEHTELLGDSRSKIAVEKLAVVPDGGVVVMGEDGWEELVPQASRTIQVSVGGSFQDQNRAVARAAVETALGRPVDPAPMDRVEVPGRLQVRGSRPLEIWDGAHNPAGMQRLVAELPALLGDRQAVAVFSALADKDVATMLALLREVCPTVVATTSSNPRALPASVISGITGGAAADDPHHALEAARVLAGPRGAVVVCGSLYLLHDLDDGPPPG